MWVCVWENVNDGEIYLLINLSFGFKIEFSCGCALLSMSSGVSPSLLYSHNSLQFIIIFYCPIQSKLRNRIEYPNKPNYIYPCWKEITKPEAGTLHRPNFGLHLFPCILHRPKFFNFAGNSVESAQAGNNCWLYCFFRWSWLVLLMMIMALDSNWVHATCPWKRPLKKEDASTMHTYLGRHEFSWQGTRRYPLSGSGSDLTGQGFGMSPSVQPVIRPTKTLKRKGGQAYGLVTFFNFYSYDPSFHDGEPRRVRGWDLRECSVVLPVPKKTKLN